MNGERGRRTTLALLIVIIAAFVALSIGQSASAKDAQKIPDYSSKADFKSSCELLGGTFIEDGLGNTECHYPDGSWTECDANGGDCWYTPARPAPPMGIPGPDIDGSIATAPIVADTDQNAASDDHELAKAKHHKGKKGKTHGHRGK